MRKRGMNPLDRLWVTEKGAEMTACEANGGRVARRTNERRTLRRARKKNGFWTVDRCAGSRLQHRDLPM